MQAILNDAFVLLYDGRLSAVKYSACVLGFVFMT
jgi:hypothetical protein